METNEYSTISYLTTETKWTARPLHFYHYEMAVYFCSSYTLEKTFFLLP